MYYFMDWLTVIIPYKHDKRFHNGFLNSCDANGEIEFTKHKRLMIEASSSARVSIRSVNTFEMMGNNEDITKYSFKIACLDNLKDKREMNFDALEISGNPTKWLNRGHNIWGLADLEKVTAQFLKEVLQKAEIVLNVWELKQLKSFHIYPTRIDLTTNIRTSSESEAQRLVEAIKGQSESKYQAAKGYGTSAYFGERSKIKTTVFYKKKDEFIYNSKKSKDDKHIQSIYNILAAESENLVRYEYRLKSQWFRKRHINTLSRFFSLLEELKPMENNLESLNLGQMDLSDDEANRQQAVIFEALKGQRVRNSVLSTFLAWKIGENVRANISKDTYYKHRKLIKGLTGIDVANRRQVSKTAGKVVPLVQYVRGFISEPSAEYKKVMYR